MITPGAHLCVWRRAVKYKLCEAYYGLAFHEFFQYRLYSSPLHAAGAYLTKKRIDAVLDVINPQDRRADIYDKLRFFAFCTRNGLPAPRVLACFAAPALQARYQGLSITLPFGESARQAYDFLIRLDAGSRIVLKEIAGSYGKGMSSIGVEKTGLFDENGDVISYERFRSEIANEAVLAKTGLLVQEQIHPHAELEPVMPNRRLGTVRIYTAKVFDRVLLPYAVIKIPSGRTLHDNFSKGKSGNALASVGIDSGIIGLLWYRKNDTSETLTTTEHHPVTGQQVTGMRLPLWDRLLEVATRAARLTPLTYVGWDIAITNDGIKIVEGNSLAHLDIVQITQQRGLRPELENLILLSSHSV